LQAAIVRGENVSNDEIVRIASTAKRLLETIRSKADAKAAKSKAESPLEYAGLSPTPKAHRRGKGASFNLEAVKAQIEKAIAAHAK
jgi:hypothetical protein